MIETSSIKSKDDLVLFLEKLSEEYRANGNTWENRTLQDFLEALVSWGEDMDGYYKNMDLSSRVDLNQSAVSWRVFADMLMAARVYE